MRVEVQMINDSEAVYNFLIKSLNAEMSAIYEKEVIVKQGNTYHKTLKSKLKKMNETKFKVKELREYTTYHLEFYNGPITNNLLIELNDIDDKCQLVYNEYVDTDDSKMERNYKIVGKFFAIINKRKIKKRFKNMDMMITQEIN